MKFSKGDNVRVISTSNKYYGDLVCGAIGVVTGISDTTRDYCVRLDMDPVATYYFKEHNIKFVNEPKGCRLSAVDTKCPDCHGTGEIVLFTSVIKCKCMEKL